MAGPTPASVHALVTGLIDYAGLFPPAQLGMAEAMTNYADYLHGPHSWMLGRFVIPVARLTEFDEVSAALLPAGEGSDPWRLTALVGDDVRDDVQAALKFNCRHWHGSEIGHAVIDSIEMRARTPVDPALRASVPDFFALYVESATGPAGAAELDAIRAAGARAKIRMGGVTVDAFPSPDDVVAFLSACFRRRLPFKATAGLHHAIRGEYPLTYEAAATRAAMYGFLNVLMATAVISSEGSAAAARDALLASDLRAFRFDEEGVTRGELRLSTGDLIRARELATSYGSCSFREPVDELLAAGLIT